MDSSASKNSTLGAERSTSSPPGLTLSSVDPIKMRSLPFLSAKRRKGAPLGHVARTARFFQLASRNRSEAPPVPLAAQQGAAAACLAEQVERGRAVVIHAQQDAAAPAIVVEAQSQDTVRQPAKPGERRAPCSSTSRKALARSSSATGGLVVPLAPMSTPAPSSASANVASNFQRRLERSRCSQAPGNDIDLQFTSMFHLASSPVLATSRSALSANLLYRTSTEHGMAQR